MGYASAGLMLDERTRVSGMDPAEGTVGTVTHGVSLSPPALFHGRDEEMARMKLLHGNVRIAVVHGTEGLGKSALAYEAARTGKTVRIPRDT